MADINIAELNNKIYDKLKRADNYRLEDINRRGEGLAQQGRELLDETMRLVGENFSELSAEVQVRIVTTKIAFGIGLNSVELEIDKKRDRFNPISGRFE